jgi:uncharacterized protein
VDITPERDPFPEFPGLMRADALYNPFLGYGNARDKVAGGSFLSSVALTWVELKAMYYHEDIPAKIVDLRPNEMFRRGYSLTADDEEAAGALQERGEKLGVSAKMREALKLGRLFGGALLVVGADDGAGDLTLPLVEARVRDVRYLNVLDRRFVTVDSYQMNPFLPRYGEPEIYGLHGLEGSVSRVHASRVIRFDGVAADVHTRRELGGWSFSVLQRPYETIRRFETAFASAGVLLSDAGQAVWKIQGLVDMIASNPEALEERMRQTDMSRSAGRGVTVDAENEDFTRVATPFSGIDVMLDRFMMRLSAAADLPVTILMGRSPAGQNATGDSDFRAFYGTVASDQEEILEPALKRFYEVLGAGALPGLDVDFAPLWEPTDKEKAETSKIQADTDKVYVDLGALHPEEVALARFSKDGNGEIEIDEEALKKSLEQEIKLALEPKPEPPAPPATPPGNDPPVPPPPSPPQAPEPGGAPPVR